MYQIKISIGGKISSPFFSLPHPITVSNKKNQFFFIRVLIKVGDARHITVSA